MSVRTSRRDDFPIAVRDKLAVRVRLLCSRPECRILTRGPGSKSSDVVNLGVAAHITAAAPGGPRYDSSLTPAQRKSIDNGLWLCQNCAARIDRDPEKYPVELLRKWKAEAEAQTADLLGNSIRQNEFGASAGTETKHAAERLMFNQIEELAGRITTEVSHHLAEARLTWTKGDRSTPLEWIQELKNDSSGWAAISDDMRIRLLCFQGNILLESGDIQGARESADAARTIGESESEIRLRALIAFWEGGATIALDILGQRSDEDSIHLRAALLLEDRQPGQCLALLSDTEKYRSAEACRLRGLAYLLQRDLESAHHEIDSSLRLEPDSVRARQSAALVSYYSAVVLGCIPEHFEAWPEPIEPQFIKQDDSSMEHLQKAAELFAGLIVGAQSPDEKLRMQSWRLACLANDPAKFEEANNCCLELLTHYPGNYVLVAWASARGFEVGWERMADAIQAKLADNTVNISEVVALLNCFLNLNIYADALNVLDSTFRLFRSPDEQFIWAVWKTRMLVVVGKADDASELVAQFERTETLTKQQIQLLKSLLSDDEERRLAIIELWNMEDLSSNPNIYLAYYESLAEQGLWEKIIESADSIITTIETPHAVGFVASSCYYAGRIDLCLQILDSNTQLFRHNRLTPQLRRLRIKCQHLLGLLPAAIDGAWALMNDEPSLQHLSDLTYLYFVIGDLKNLAITARAFLDYADTPIDLLLQLSHLLRLEDRALAENLWAAAASMDIPDSLVGPTLGLSFELGLELSPIHRDLIARLDDLAQAGAEGIRRVDVSEMTSVIEHIRHDEAKIFEEYVQGRIPVHFIQDRLDVPLSHFYIRNFLDNSNVADPVQRRPIMVRHGGKQLVERPREAARNWRLSADVTALLLADRLDILGQVEREFKPIYIPQDLLGALSYSASLLLPHQPTQIEVKQKILFAIRQGTIHIAACDTNDQVDFSEMGDQLGIERHGAYQAAVARQGFVVDYLPLRKAELIGEMANVSEDVAKRVVNLRTVVDSLSKYGYLTKAKVMHVQKLLGAEEHALPAHGNLPRQAKLFFVGNAIEQLIVSGILNEVNNCFNVSVTKQYADDVEQVIETFEQNQRERNLLNRLHRRISDGIKADIYRLLPAIQPSANNELEMIGPATKCLLGLLQFQGGPDDVIWTDDRYLNAYSNRDGIPIIGINEVLKILATSSALIPDDYYAKISELRRAGAYFLPLIEDELLYALSQATIENDRLVENALLREIRQYSAASLLRGTWIQHPPFAQNVPNVKGEMDFVISTKHTMAAVLRTIWSDPQVDHERRIAESNWLIECLDLDISSSRRLIWINPEQDDLHLFAVDLANWIGIGIQISPNDAQHNNRLAYFDWLMGILIYPRLKTEPKLTELIVEYIKQHFQAVLDGSAATEDQSVERRALIRAGLNRMLWDVPNMFRERLQKDTQFAHAMGIETVTTIQIDRVHFEVDQFVAAVVQSLAGLTINVTPVDSDTPVRFEAKVDGEPINDLLLTFLDDDRRITVSDPMLALLSPLRSEHREVLHKNRHWFECSAESYVHTVTQIVNEDSPLLRFKLAQEWSDQSIESWYRRLHVRCRQTGHFSEDELLPTQISKMLRHLHLDSVLTPTAPSERLGLVTADDIINTDGIIQGFLKLSALPVPLPAVLFEQTDLMSLSEQRVVVRELLRSVYSPVGQVHLIHLLLYLGTGHRAFTRLAQWIARVAISENGKASYNAFMSILQWTYISLPQLTDYAELPPSFRLTLYWYHAHRLYNIFADISVPKLWLQKQFDLMASRGAANQLFERRSAEWFDVSHPNRSQWHRFLLAGLSYAFGGKSTDFNEALTFQFLATTFKISEELPVPSLDLLKYFNRSTNYLGSFLWIDSEQALRVLLGTGDAAEFSATVVHSNRAEILGQLTGEELNTQALFSVGAILDDLPPPENLLEPLRKTLLHFALLKHVDSGLYEATLALKAAAKQVQHLSDPRVHKHIKEQLFVYVSFLNDNQDTVSLLDLDGKSSPEISLLLIGIMLDLALVEERQIDQVSQFCDMAQRSLDIWPGLAEYINMVVFRFYRELPVALVADVARLHLRTRTLCLLY